jgi:nicotinate-nucleotide pyrophosphorylase (carboxylating)
MIVGDEADVGELIALAKREDLGTGDITAALVAPQSGRATFSLLAKQPGVLSGQEVAAAILHAYDESIEIDWTDGVSDGTSWQDVPCILATITGPIETVLSAERVLLNFLQRLCGVATLTRRYVEAVADTNATILDTRKTTPGWRTLEKYAVRCGRGENHRRGLYDAMLVKDNHLADIACSNLASSIFEMLNRMHGRGIKPAFVEVEADSLEQVAQLFKVMGIDIVLLDNFSLDDLRTAVAMRDDEGLAGRVALEASGGITLETVRAVAETGVDRISIGAMTHSATAIDLSLERV